MFIFFCRLYLQGIKTFPVLRKVIGDARLLIFKVAWCQVFRTWISYLKYKNTTLIIYENLWILVLKLNLSCWNILVMFVLHPFTIRQLYATSRSCEINYWLEIISENIWTPTYKGFVHKWRHIYHLSTQKGLSQNDVIQIQKPWTTNRKRRLNNQFREHKLSLDISFSICSFTSCSTVILRQKDILAFYTDIKNSTLKKKYS